MVYNEKRVEHYFRKGYKTSLRYSQEKESLVRYVREVVESVSKKLKRSQIGKTIPEFVSYAKTNEFLSSFESFQENVNGFLKGRFRRKFTEDEILFLWILISKDFHGFKHHKLSELVGLLGKESKFMEIALGIFRRVSQSLGNQLNRSEGQEQFLGLIKSPDLEQIDEVVKGEEGALREGNINGFLAKVDEEDGHKRRIYLIVENFLEKREKEKVPDESRRLLLQAAAMGVAGVLLSGCSASKFMIQIPEEGARVGIDSPHFKLIDTQKIIAKGTTITRPLIEIAEYLEYILIFIIHNGKLERIKLTKEILKKYQNPALLVNGFVVFVHVSVNESIKKVSLNNSTSFTLASFKDGLFMRPGGGEPIENYLPNVNSGDTESAEYKEFYNILNRGDIKSYQLGDRDVTSPNKIPISEKENNVILFECNGRKYGLFFKQTTHLHGTYDLVPKESYDDVFVFYYGNNYGEFKTIPDIERKINVVHRGIYNIEKIFDANVVSIIGIVDQKVEGAMPGKGQIYINFPYFTEKSIPDLLNMAEHEALHLLTDFLKFNKNKKLLKIYHDLVRGFHNNKGKEENSYRQFFLFINEYNYFEDATAGHSRDLIEEFTTSFVHTLMYIDLLEGNLLKVKLEFRGKVISWYHETLKTMAKVAPSKQKRFFEERLSLVSRLLQNYG